jgi:hypothetical protein
MRGRNLKTAKIGGKKEVSRRKSVNEGLSQVKKSYNEMSALIYI